MLPQLQPLSAPGEEGHSDHKWVDFFLLIPALPGFGHGFRTTTSAGACSLHPPSTCSTSLGSSCSQEPGLSMTLQLAGPWVDAMPCQSLFPLGSFPAVCMPSLPRRRKEEGREWGPPSPPNPQHFLLPQWPRCCSAAKPWLCLPGQ